MSGPSVEARFVRESGTAAEIAALAEPVLESLGFRLVLVRVLGALFALAYPRRPVLICCVVFGAALILELLQTVTPDRHGTLIDALEKLAGGAAGILIARIFQSRKAGSISITE